MRREHEDMRMENLKLLQQKKEPSSYVDILTIIEHPRFKKFYDELIEDGIITMDDSSDEQIASKALGDLISIGLKSDYGEYDLYLPYIISDVEETLKDPNYTVENLQPIT
jgi:type III restriction enzyme